MTQDEARALVKRHGGNKAAAARAAGMPVQTFRDRLNGKQPAGRVAQTEAVASAGPRRTISEADLLAETDIDTKLTLALRSALRDMTSGEYMRDVDMRHECHVGDARAWRDIREAAEFWRHCMIVGNNSEPAVYWGRPESVAGMIERGKARRPAWVKAEVAA